MAGIPDVKAISGIKLKGKPGASTPKPPKTPSPQGPPILKKIAGQLISKVAGITLDVSIGDTVLMGKFKNSKKVVKKISEDKHGMPTINGRVATTFRYAKKEKKDK